MISRTFREIRGVTIRTNAPTAPQASASMNDMKFTSKISLFLLASALAVALPRGAEAQNGSIQFDAHVRTSSGTEEPVRSFTFYLLRKSYADIQAEALAAAPKPKMNEFIDKLDVSKELKAWMKKNQCVAFSGEDFLKLIKVDDVMDVPEFNAAYLDRMAGDQAAAFPEPKYKEADKKKDPDKYDAAVKAYHDQIRAFFKAHPNSVSGIDMELEAIDPAHKWEVVEAKAKAGTDRQALTLAQGKYLVARTDTDLDGRAFFRAVPAGTYYLSTLNLYAFSGDQREKWDTPITVTPGKPTNIALSSINSVQASSTP